MMIKETISDIKTKNAITFNDINNQEYVFGKRYDIFAIMIPNSNDDLVHIELLDTNRGKIKATVTQDTIAALRQFQKDNHLVYDILVGSETSGYSTCMIIANLWLDK